MRICFIVMFWIFFSWLVERSSKLPFLLLMILLALIGLEWIALEWKLLSIWWFHTKRDQRNHSIAFASVSKYRGHVSVYHLFPPKAIRSQDESGMLKIRWKIPHKKSQKRHSLIFFIRFNAINFPLFTIINWFFSFFLQFYCCCCFHIQ